MRELNKSKIEQRGENLLSNDISRTQLRKNILAFVFPCAAELMLTSLISIINMAMVGHLGAYAISAVGLTNQPVLIATSVFLAFNVGSTALVTRFIGAKDNKGAKTVTIQSLSISLIFGLLMSLFCFIFSNWIVVTIGAQEDTVYYANMYMKYMAIGILFQSIPIAVTSLYRGAGETKIPMKYNIVANIVNVAVGAVLIYGVGIVPAMGLEGAAIAATLAKVTACVLAVHSIFKSDLPIALSIRDSFRLDFGILKRIVRIGSASALEQFLLRVGFMVITMTIADLGTVAFATSQVFDSIMSLSENLSRALSMASTSFLGRTLGAGKPKLTQAYCKEIHRISLMVAAVMCVLFFFAGRPIAHIFTSDAEVIIQVVFLLKLSILMIPGQNTQHVFASGLRGIGDTKWPLFSALIGIICVRMPIIVILIKKLNFGVSAICIAGAFDQNIRAIILYLRFKGGKWKQIKI